jgi:hypothetical protein
MLACPARRAASRLSGLAQALLPALLGAATAEAQDSDVNDAWLDSAGAIWEEPTWGRHTQPARAQPVEGEPVSPGTLQFEAGDWTLQPGALWSVNAIDYERSNKKSDGLETEAASLILRGVHPEDLLLWLELDIDGEDTRHHVREAWVERAYAGDSWLRAGQIRVALGTEFATREENLPLVGYGFPGWLDGRWDTGVAWDGYTGWSWFQLAATTGSGFDLDGNKRHDAELMGRLVVLPDHDPAHGFDGIFGGLALSWMPENHDEIHLGTPLEQTVFTTPEVNADGARFLHMELGARYGAFRWGWESVTGRLEHTALPGGGHQTFDELGAWSMFTSFNFTGPAPIWHRGGWQGYGPDDFDAGQALPVELAVRYSNGDIDRDLFDTGITTYSPSTQEVRTISAALMAYLCPLSRIGIQWTGVIADHELATFGGENRDSTLALRFDQRF